MQFPPLTPINKAVVMLCVAVFALQQIVPGVLERWMALWPVASGGFMPWQIATHALLHDSVPNLVLNLLVFWLLGSSLESVWGQRRYVNYLIACGLAAGVAHLLLTFALGIKVPASGTSGVILGMLMGFALTFPDAKVMLLIPPIPIKAKHLVVLIAITVVIFGLLGSIASLATLAGMLGGWLMIRYWRSGGGGKGRGGSGGPRPMH
jgi:membrane associated rhomboid family serine protease